MLWLDDKLRPVEVRVKRLPKNDEVTRRVEQQIDLKYSRFQRVSSTARRPLFRCFPAAYSPHTHRISACDSADFPRLFRMFCTSDCARFFPQALRSNFGGNGGLCRKEKGRKESERIDAAEIRE
jgi:hypothetical protein